MDTEEKQNQIDEEQEIDQSSWKESVSEEYRNDPSLRDFKDLNGLAKSFIESQKMIGSSIRLPKEDSTEEEINKFYSKLGRPESPEIYKYDQPQDIPEDLKNDYSDLKRVCHQAGLTNKQFEELAAWNDKDCLEYFNKTKADLEAKEQELDQLMLKQFGGSGDEKEQQSNVQKAYDNAKSIISKVLTKEEADNLINLDNKALVGVVSLLNKFEKQYIGEGNFINNGGSGGQSSEALKKELSEIMARIQKDDILSPTYEQDVKRKNELYAMGITLY